MHFRLAKTTQWMTAMRKKRSFSDRAAVGQTLTLSGHPAAKLGSRSCIDGAAEVGVHKTSMLQDLERGRPIEIDARLR
jgi:ketopantoate reductase